MKLSKRLALLLALVMLTGLISACGHTHEFGEWTTTVEATCTTDGSRERACECGEKETEVISSSGHKYGESEEITAATCTEDGESRKTCSACGDVVTEKITSPGHSFTAATSFAPKTCTVCGETEGEALSKLIAVGDVIESEDHSFTVSSVAFTGSLSEKRGNVTYNHSKGYFLAVTLSFTNLATEAFDRWGSERISDASLEYKGKYQYEGDYWVPVDDIVPLATDNLYITYEVPESMAEDTTGSVLCTFTIDGEVYSMVIQAGDGSEDTQAEPSEKKDVSGEISVGDVVTNDSSFSFVLSDMYFTAKPSYKVGNITYSFGSGSYYFVCVLDFTNMSSEALDDWNDDRLSEMKIVFSDKYNYEGDCWIPENEIVPLDTGKLFILAEVPESVETSGDSLVLTFTVDGNAFTVNYR